ncbi:MAG: YjbQ family protein [Myxococcales bacterium]|nr:YjbQ family protein [Myxococcales bacterium]MCZ6714578.1 secondary thiamine-phosphate synthase enzyme YjbQ [Deltaproteobacteria bacterium]TDI99022.1 MAG: YjbQ family protein [Deltaproteobacteria bacterium]TDJ10183.1 MAG: YjbQ family protein [Deltaproteobacteria bacterium]
MAEIFSVSTSQAKQCIDITERVREIVRKSGVKSGLCQVMVLHATAAIAINENDDPNIGVDLLTALDRAIPDHAGWLHDRIDNNAQAHIKAAILGPSELIPIADGDLLLGTWQGLMLIELDGPRSTRRVAVSLIS